MFPLVATGFVRMQIDNEQQYQDAMTELKLLEEAPVADEAARRSGSRRRKVRRTAEGFRTA